MSTVKVGLVSCARQLSWGS